MIKLCRFIRGRSLIFTLIGIACIAGAAYFDATQPTWLSEALNALGNPTKLNWPKFWFSVSMMAVYAVCSLITGIGGSFCGSIAALLIAQNVRNGMYQKIQSLSFSDLDKVTTPSLITRMTNDVQKYQINMQLIITVLFRAPVTFCISLYNAFTLGGTTIYGWIVLAIVVAMLSIIAIIGLRVMPIFEKAQKQLDLTNTIMRENILGTRVVKAFNIQQDQYNRYQKENTSLKKLLIHGQALMLPIMSIITFCVNAGVIVILTVAGAEFAKNGTAIDAGIFAFTQILIIVLMSAIMAVMVIVNSTRTIASVRRINQVFNINPSINEPVSPMLMSNDYSVEFKNVNFKYAGDAKTNVLCNINFDIPSGQTLGVVGGTGSGKSTVANLIPRLYDVTEGQILIGGIDIKNISLTELNEKVGIVLQEAMLMSGTIESNLKFGNHNATTEEMQAALADASAAKFVDELPEKLQSHVEQRGRNFSGGQKQRLSLARTLIKKPKVLILDDTTSALDLITEANVQANLLSNYKDTTKIIVSQRISSVRNANKIVVLNDGAVVGFGTHDELVKSNSTYRDIAISQLGQEVLN